jgi:circadian clock protein KaiC
MKIKTGNVPRSKTAPAGKSGNGQLKLKVPIVPRLKTGIPNLDLVLGGGLPKGTISVLAGPPGSGKTILAQQICFNNAASGPVLYFTTLSEPVAKSLLYLSQFTFFDPSKINESIHLVDLGTLLRADGLEQVTGLLMEHVKRVRPEIVVIDSFKSFDDIAKSTDDFRRFGYQLAVNLMAWEVTGLLLGEYAQADYETNPLFSIVDGLITLSHKELSGEWQRFLQVQKMRGIKHSRDPHPFAIEAGGIQVYAPRVTIRRDPNADHAQSIARRSPTGITGLDLLLGEGIPHGSTVAVAGIPGTGKTVLLLEFLFRGARAGQKGVLFSFEETPERLRATARGLGFDLDREIANGMIEIVYVSQPDILVEADMLRIEERVKFTGAQRIAVDSVSLFLHKIIDPRIVQEKIFQLASIVQNAGGIGLVATDIRYGSGLISRLGVEETLVDGVILLTSTETGLQRERYLEVYKLRNTAHLTGRHQMIIGEGGLTIFPHDQADATPVPQPKRRPA